MNIFRTFKKPNAAIYFVEAEQYCSSNYISPVIPDVKQPAIKYSICVPKNDCIEDAVVDSAEESNYSNAHNFSRRYNLNTDDLLHSLNLKAETTFVEKLREHIRNKHMRESAVYKAAQVDRRLFSKIINNRIYAPSKDTCIALALALQLNQNDFSDLLNRAGYTLSRSSRRDLIIGFVVHKGIYDLNTVNEILYHMGEKTLGR
jgi:hypothetical protein